MVKYRLLTLPFIRQNGSHAQFLYLVNKTKSLFPPLSLLVSRSLRFHHLFYPSLELFEEKTPQSLPSASGPIPAVCFAVKERLVYPTQC